VTDNKINEQILELLDIVEDHEDFSYTGKRNLKKKVLDWTDKWLMTTTVEQYLHKPQLLTSELMDELKIDLIRRMADELCENSALFYLQTHKISAKVLSMRRKPNE